MVRETDQGRQELQVKFDLTAQKVKEDTEMKKRFQDNLVDEITQLKQELQERSRAAAQREQEHIDQLARQ